MIYVRRPIRGSVAFWFLYSGIFWRFPIIGQIVPSRFNFGFRIAVLFIFAEGKIASRTSRSANFLIFIDVFDLRNGGKRWDGGNRWDCWIALLKSALLLASFRVVTLQSTSFLVNLMWRKKNEVKFENTIRRDMQLGSRGYHRLPKSCDLWAQQLCRWELPCAPACTTCLVIANKVPLGFRGFQYTRTKCSHAWSEGDYGHIPWALSDNPPSRRRMVFFWRRIHKHCGPNMLHFHYFIKYELLIYHYPSYICRSECLVCHRSFKINGFEIFKKCYDILRSMKNPLKDLIFYGVYFRYESFHVQIVFFWLPLMVGRYGVSFFGLELPFPCSVSSWQSTRCYFPVMRCPPVLFVPTTGAEFPAIHRCLRRSGLLGVLRLLCMVELPKTRWGRCSERHGEAVDTV